MGIDNVLQGHGIGIAITGMIVVFSGLVLVVLFLTALPLVLAWVERRGWQRAARGDGTGDRAAARAAAGAAGAAGAAARPIVAPPAATGRGADGMDADLLAAITYVLQAERDRLIALDDQAITLRPDEEQQRVWTAIGRMRTLATRM